MVMHHIGVEGYFSGPIRTGLVFMVLRGNGLGGYNTYHILLSASSTERMANPNQEQGRNLLETKTKIQTFKNKKNKSDGVSMSFLFVTDLSDLNKKRASSFYFELNT
jgi:hypothetical protein